MAVYVDAAMHPYGRMKMSHMMADTTAELLEMAHRIGVARRWLQNAGTPTEHFDVCAAKRDLAVSAGAKPVNGRELVYVVRAKRAATPTPPTKESP